MTPIIFNTADNCPFFLKNGFPTYGYVMCYCRFLAAHTEQTYIDCYTVTDCDLLYIAKDKLCTMVYNNCNLRYIMRVKCIPEFKPIGLANQLIVKISITSITSLSYFLTTFRCSNGKTWLKHANQSINLTFISPHISGRKPALNLFKTCFWPGLPQVLSRSQTSFRQDRCNGMWA